nr:MAG TPA: hypothetical protein [Caudoviricetes sp.]
MRRPSSPARFRNGTLRMRLINRSPGLLRGPERVSGLLWVIVHPA